jgi:hypothetical protein
MGCRDKRLAARAGVNDAFEDAIEDAKGNEPMQRVLKELQAAFVLNQKD